MKSGKAGGSTELVGEMIRAAGQAGVKKMTENRSMVVDEEKVPRDWELSTLIPIYKGEGDPLECEAHRAIKLLEHEMKILERVLESTLRKNVSTDGMQIGFMPGEGTTDSIFVIRQMHGHSEEFEVKVGLHQESVLSPLLFVAVMEVLTREIREGLTWELLYANDLVLMAENIEAKGLKVNTGKTKVMVSGNNCGDVEWAGKWPCTVYGNSVVLEVIRFDVQGVVDEFTSGAQM